VENLLASDYPAECVNIVVALDARVGGMVEDYSRLVGSAVQVLVGDLPGGKAAALNAGARAATGDILLLVDTRQRFERSSIPALLRGFDVCQYAAVSGVVELERDDAIMRRYWDFEIGIRRGQAACSGLVTTSGAITAVRRDLWAPLPVGAICDDLFLTIGLAQRGYRVGLVETAVAHDPQRLSREDRLAKKVRTLTGLVQFIRWNPSALVPWRNPVWAHFYAHKLLRLATPVLLLFLTVSLSAWLMRHSGRLVSEGLLGAFLATLAAALAKPARLSRAGAALGMTASLLLVPVIAMANGLRGRWDVWQPAPPGARQP